MTAPMEYPAAARADLVEELHGHLVADPYRWLEDEGDPRTAAWSTAQRELFRGRQAAWPDLPALRARLADLLDTGALSPPAAHGPWQLRTRRARGRDLPVLEARAERDGAVRTVFDPLVLDPSGATVLDDWTPSWEGASVAVQTSTGGTEDSVLRVLDTATGAVLDGPIDRLRRSAIAWLPGGGAFYYVRRPAPETIPGEERYHRRVYLHRVGSDPAEDRLVFGEGREMTQYYTVATTPDGRWLTLTASTGASPRTDVWLADLTASEPERPLLRPVQEGVAARTELHLRAGTGPRDALYLRTRRDAPRGRIERATPADPGTREVLIAEDPQAVVEDFTVLDGPELARPLALVTRTRHALSEITVHDLATGEQLGEVALPGPGTVGALKARSGPGHEVWFRYGDFTTPSTVLHYDARSGRTEPWDAGTRGPDHDVMVRQVSFPAQDGTQVRMFLVSPTGRPDRPRPTVITGYGGFGASIVPGFAPQALAWARAGGVYAFACLRGGGEEGEQWHRAGRRERKSNTFDDLAAAADWLLAGGWTAPGRLGLVGSSNGGLTMGAALTRSPAKYAAVVAIAPLLDMVRYELSGMGPSWREEYGSAADPVELGWLLGYSPYHQVREDVRYPAVLLGAADGDTRVDPLHARKMCAALQHAAARAGGGPVLLRLERGVGHGIRGVATTAELLADILAFLAERLGLPIGDAAGGEAGGEAAEVAAGEETEVTAGAAAGAVAGATRQQAAVAR
ncbi:prolyl oligopeptidase family serine peptidase [Kitasatospora sp. NBC_01287]|uniref:prolyl oligopeptidase family serine peptidase n=1 Tax=Kitasatospora sp. NBC_01287 TaxID=2903573 RepID=UPI00224EB1DF|nr:prolyl oligopeptidase family serine peptidase [Kitasatospora sp. NBC_01287]MCX4744421.1 prolyl oligopeptidase family serine peptidase [Kitasatospora sp. NBC_01287]